MQNEEGLKDVLKMRSRTLGTPVFYITSNYLGLNKLTFLHFFDKNSQQNFSHFIMLDPQIKWPCLGLLLHIVMQYHTLFVVVHMGVTTNDLARDALIG
jgi:hypothetical protein